MLSCYFYNIGYAFLSTQVTSKVTDQRKFNDRPKFSTSITEGLKNKPAAQAADADRARCNSTNRQNLPLH